MGINSLDLCELAKELGQPTSGEAKARAAIGRAYLAAYHAVQGLVQALPPTDAVQGTHRETIQKLREWRGRNAELKRSARAIARGLEHTYLEKRMADYDGDYVVTQVSVDMAIDRAKKIIQLTEDLGG